MMTGRVAAVSTKACCSSIMEDNKDSAQTTQSYVYHSPQVALVT